MVRRVLLLATVLLTLPTLASAYNYWSVARSASPTSLVTNVTPPSGVGYSTTAGSNTTNITDAATTYADYSVATPAGYALSYVSIDGVTYSAPNAPDGIHYRVNKGTRINHAISVTYKVGTNTITPSQTSGGYVTPGTTQTVAYGGSATFTVAANSGYKIVSVTADAGAVTLAGQMLDAAGNLVKGTYTFTNVTGSGHTITATYALIPVLKAVVGAPGSAALNVPLTVNGSASSAVGTTPTYTWSVSPSSGASITPTTGATTTTFTATTGGTYTVTLTLTGAGAPTSTASTAIFVQAQALTDSQGCIACHNVSTPAPVTAYTASAHAATNTVTCDVCHVTSYGHPSKVNAATVSANTFQVLSTVAGMTKGTNFCSKCHSASVAQVQASIHYTMNSSEKLVCTDCHAAGHNPQFNTAACAGCHATVNDHTADTMGTKACIDCHDKHNPTTVTGTLGPATAHPAVTLYTFEEIGMQMAGGGKVPVQVDANGKGMPYSPKQTCGTAGCHVINGIDYTYDKISDHAFHSNQGRSEYVDSANGKFDATKNKPWTQSTAMVGKW